MPDPDGGDAGIAPDTERLTSDILRQWRGRLRRRDDDRARSGDRGERERLLVASLLRASSAKDDAILPGLAAAAAQYGAGQRHDRIDPGGLCDELSCLRHIVWSKLKSKEPNVDKAVDRILRFDRALSIVVRAALTAGYSQSTIEANAPCSEQRLPERRCDDDEAPNDSQRGGSS